MKKKDIINSLKALLNTELDSGVSEIYFDRRKMAKKDSKVSAAGKLSKVEELEALRKVAVVCHKCHLDSTRTNVVFGEGNPDAELMFIGEAPGRDEDLQARPFVGRAGQLLTKIIESIALRREDVYIANILKCRPPDNRNPFPGEIISCSPYLEKQIELINPKVICALGKFAAQTLLKTETPISGLRGNFHDYKGIKVMPTFHPAYLLRNPAGKKEVWIDMKKIAWALGIEIKSKQK